MVTTYLTLDVFPSTEFKVTFFVVKEPIPVPILGIPFMNEFGVIIDASIGQITVNDRSAFYKLPNTKEDNEQDVEL